MWTLTASIVQCLEQIQTATTTKDETSNFLLQKLQYLLTFKL